MPGTTSPRQDKNGTNPLPLISRCRSLRYPVAAVDKKDTSACLLESQLLLPAVVAAAAKQREKGWRTSGVRGPTRQGRPRYPVPG